MTMLETLPNWFWILYYGLSLFIFTVGVVMISKKEFVLESISSLAILALSLIAVFFISFNREEGFNELEWFIKLFTEQNIATILLGVGFLYQCHYMYMVFQRIFKKRSSI